MSQHIVTSFDADLKSLSQTIEDMGERVQRLLEDALSALAKDDGDLAQKVIEADRHVDLLRHNVGTARPLTGVRLLSRSPASFRLRLTCPRGTDDTLGAIVQGEDGDHNRALISHPPSSGGGVCRRCRGDPGRPNWPRRC